MPAPPADAFTSSSSPAIRPSRPPSPVVARPAPPRRPTSRATPWDSSMNCLARALSASGSAVNPPMSGPRSGPAGRVRRLGALEVGVGGVHARAHPAQALVQRLVDGVPVLLHRQVGLLRGAVPGGSQLGDLRLQ